MGKKELEKNLKIILKQTEHVIPKELFQPLYQDVTDWQAWNVLYGRLIAYGVTDTPYRDIILLAFECAKAASKLYLGDVA